MKSTLLTALVILSASLVPLKATALEPIAVAEDSNNQVDTTANSNDIEDPTKIFAELDTVVEGFEADEAENSVLADDVISYARQFLGRPYRHGSGGPKSFDCSGFTSYVFRNFDITLSRSSREQYSQGVSISRDDIRPGDLLFFSGRRGGKTVGHVAIATSVDENGTVNFIHAAIKGGIRHDKYPDGGYYSRRFIGARRVLD